MPKKCKAEKWFDLSGKPITYERVKSHDRIVYGMIKKMLSNMRLDEAAMDINDLVSECRLQVLKGLLKFDPYQALNAVTKQTARKKKTDEEHLRWKKENPEEALKLAEERWVSRRLFNHLRRLRWDHSEKEIGGKTISYTRMLAAAEKTLDFDGQESAFGVDEASPEELIFGVEGESILLDREQAERDRDDLMRILNTEGKTAFKEALKHLDPMRLDDLQALCENQTRNERVFDLSGGGEDQEAITEEDHGDTDDSHEEEE